MGANQSVPSAARPPSFEDGNPPDEVKIRMYEDKVRKVTGDPFWTWNARRDDKARLDNEWERARYQEFERSRGRYGSEKTGMEAGLPSHMQRDDIPREQQEASQRMGERIKEKVEDFKETARDAVLKTGRQWEAESKEIGDGAKRLLKTRTNENAEKYGTGADTPAVQGYQDRHDNRPPVPTGAKLASDRLQEYVDRTAHEGQRKVDEGKDAARRAEENGKSWLGWTKEKVEEVDRSIEHGLETAKDKTKSALGEVAHKTEDVYDRVIGRAKDKADDVKDDVRRAKDDISRDTREPREKTREAADKTKDAAGSWLGWGKNKVKEGEERVKEGYEETKEEAQRKYEQARDRVSRGVDEVKHDTEAPREKAREAGEKTKDVANSWVGWGKSKAGEGEDKARESYGRAKDDVSRGLDDVGRRAEEAKRSLERGWKETKEEAKETYEQAKERTERAFRGAGDRAEESADRARGAVRGAKEEGRREYAQGKEEAKGWFNWLGGDKKEEKLDPESRAKFDAADRDLKEGYEKLRRGVSEEADAVSTRAGEYARAAKDATKNAGERLGEGIQRGSDKGAEAVAKGVRNADDAARQTERNFERATSDRKGPEGHVPTQYERKMQALELDKQPNPEQEGREVSAVALAALGVVGPLAAILFLRAMRARK